MDSYDELFKTAEKAGVTEIRIVSLTKLTNGEWIYDHIVVLASGYSNKDGRRLDAVAVHATHEDAFARAFQKLRKRASRERKTPKSPK